MEARSHGAGLGSVGGAAPGGAYDLEGSLLELSWGTPLRSVTAWRITTGRINGVDVSGQVVVVISIPSREALRGRAVRMILLEERANPEEVLALLDAFHGRLGGPLGKPVHEVVEEREFAQVPIEYRLAAGRAVISVTNRLSVVARLDPPASVSEVSVGVPEHGLRWHDDDVPVTYREVSVSDTGTRTRRQP